MADGLFNYQDPRVLQEQYLAQQRQNATAAAQLPMLQQVIASGGNLGATLGTGLGRLFGGQTAAEVENEAIKGIFAGAAQQTTDPVERMKIAAAEFRKRGMEGRAVQLEKQLLDFEKTRADIGAARALEAQRSREADPVQELAKTGKYTPASLGKYAQTRNVNDLVLTERLSLPEIAKLQEYRDTLTDPKKIAEVDAVIKATSEGRGTKIEIGMGTGNTWKPTDVTAVITQSRQELNPFRTYLDEAERAINFIDLDNPKASAQVDRALAGLSGDSQLSQAEVQSVANAGSFPQQTVDAVNKFFVGGSGALSQQQKREVVEVGAAAAVMAHNKRRQELIEAYGLTGAPVAEIERAVGKERTLPSSTVRRMNDTLSKNPQQVVESMGIAYEPSLYSYRINSKGELQRARKGN